MSWTSKIDTALWKRTSSGMSCAFNITAKPLADLGSVFLAKYKSVIGRCLIECNRENLLEETIRVDKKNISSLQGPVKVCNVNSVCVIRCGGTVQADILVSLPRRNTAAPEQHRENKAEEEPHVLILTLAKSQFIRFKNRPESWSSRLEWSPVGRRVIL